MGWDIGAIESASVSAPSSGKWDIGAIQYASVAPEPVPTPAPTPTPVPGPQEITVKIGHGKLKQLKITRRKGDSSEQMFITVNNSTVVKVE